MKYRTHPVHRLDRNVSSWGGDHAEHVQHVYPDWLRVNVLHVLSVTCARATRLLWLRVKVLHVFSVTAHCYWTLMTAKIGALASDEKGHGKKKKKKKRGGGGGGLMRCDVGAQSVHRSINPCRRANKTKWTNHRCCVFDLLTNDSFIYACFQRNSLRIPS